MDNPISPTEIINTLKSDVKGHLIIWEKQFSDLTSVISKAVDDVMAVLNDIVAKVARAETRLKIVSEEVEKLEAKRDELVDRESLIRQKEEELSKDAKSLDELQKVLESRRNLLNDREAKLTERERRVSYAAGTAKG